MTMSMTHEAVELVLHIENTQRLAALRDQVNANMARKVALGTYDATLAQIAYVYLAVTAAKNYTAEHCAPADKWFEPTRNLVAAYYRDSFDSCVREHLFDDLGEQAAAILTGRKHTVA